MPRSPHRRRTATALAAVLVLAAGCAADRSGPGTVATLPTTSTVAPGTTAPPATAETTSTTGTTSPPAPVSPCERVLPGTEVGTVDDPALTEISGMAVSRRNPGVIWVHNDSGDGPFVYALDRTGALLGRYALKIDMNARDWEDMALGPGPRLGRDYLFLADIGDNNEVRDSVVVHRVLEPDLSEGGTIGGNLHGVVSVRLRYPDGAHDAEALIVDPVDGDLYVITKTISGRSWMYRAAWPGDEGGSVDLVPVASFRFGIGNLVTAADISPDGSTVGVRTYGDVFLWDRPPGSELADAVSAEWCRAPGVGEPQGEAFGFDADGIGYFTVSEGRGEPLYHFAPVD